MLKIIVTGGIGSGKSAVTKLFRQYNVPVIDTDVIARELSEQTPVLQELVTQFGADILDPTGKLNRRALREQIFNDANARHQLEAILHPRIHQQVLQELELLEARAAYGLIVIPLFVESQQDYPHDRVLVIDASEQTQLERIRQRDLQSDEQIRQILAAQASREQRLAVADDIIENNADLDILASQVQALHQHYLALAKA